jgi:hypothetical protein
MGAVSKSINQPPVFNLNAGKAVIGGGVSAADAAAAAAAAGEAAAKNVKKAKSRCAQAVALRTEIKQTS